MRYNVRIRGPTVAQIIVVFLSYRQKANSEAAAVAWQDQIFYLLVKVSMEDRFETQRTVRSARALRKASRV
jgi:hypothetical protein